MLFNKIEWNVDQDIQNATLEGQNATIEPTWLDVEWCSGGMKLLLPVSKRDAEGRSLMVFYQQTVPRRNVRFGDVLYTIWSFYNQERVLSEDLTYISISDTMKKFAEQQLERYVVDPAITLKFAQFVSPQTRFGELVHQKENIYSLKLV